MYQSANPQGAPGAETQSPGPDARQEQKKSGDDVVDAEYEVVDEEKKKKK
jgi:hypothetical protein